MSLATDPWGVARAARIRGRTLRWAVAFCVLGALALLGTTPAALAQGRTAAIRGQVAEQGTGNPVLGAVVTLVGTARTATTDSGGRFRYDGLAPGLYVVQVSAIGFTKGIYQLELGEGETASRVFELTPRVYGLDPLTVEAERRAAGRRFDEFRQRMARGVGTFITKGDIQQRNPSNLMDMLRTIRGVHAECSGSNCIVRFAGQPTSCEPKYVLDNLPSDSWIVESLDPRDIEGVEIYRGASEMPGEYGGSTAACGAIIVWTKSGP